ncbi:MAG: type 4a pilus biogenesis protein PilO [Balneolaceae bacterium]|nr:type 4a pilus biogenesis protein PilO [Balneolaceae bacterium]
MSYAVRNTLILLVVLILFVAGGWAYIHYFQVEKIDTLKVQVEEKRQELQQKQQIADQYSSIAQTYQEASDYFNNYNKALYRSSDEDKVFDFLTTLNRGAANNDFNFAFSDSTIHPKYGILNMEISGEGSYRNFFNFVRAIELSKPLNKVKNVSVTPIKVEDEYGRVNYSFNLESYYDRSEILEEPPLEVFTGAYTSVHNPFFPLVRDVQPNTENKINVEQSQLVALSTDRVFLIDQTGVMQQVRIGEEVYLGKLSSINLSNRSATFTLNKGGIVETVTLEVQNEN